MDIQAKKISKLGLCGLINTFCSVRIVSLAEDFTPNFRAAVGFSKTLAAIVLHSKQLFVPPKTTNAFTLLQPENDRIAKRKFDQFSCNNHCIHCSQFVVHVCPVCCPGGGMGCNSEGVQPPPHSSAPPYGHTIFQLKLVGKVFYWNTSTKSSEMH